MIDVLGESEDFLVIEWNKNKQSERTYHVDGHSSHQPSGWI